VLSEGQNLQDCGYLINYDLHWNPTRMVQRAWRVDRLGSSFDSLHIYNRDVEQQEAAVIVNKPVSEEQTLVSQVLQGHLNNPGFDRKELRELRQFLKQPLVGASVQQLRKVLQTYTSTNDVRGIIETVRALYQH